MIHQPISDFCSFSCFPPDIAILFHRERTKLACFCPPLIARGRLLRSQFFLPHQGSSGAPCPSPPTPGAPLSRFSHARSCGNKMKPAARPCLWLQWLSLLLFRLWCLVRWGLGSTVALACVRRNLAAVMPIYFLKRRRWERFTAPSESFVWIRLSPAQESAAQPNAAFNTYIYIY